MDYAAHYDRLISRAQDRRLVCYTEIHHVVPRCMGGGDEAVNLVKLTPEEHYVAHQLLVKIYPTERKLVFAAWMMCNGKQRSNKRYAWLKDRHRKVLSETHKGKKMPEWNKAKLIAANTGRKYSEDHRRNISEGQRGKVLSEEHRRKLSESHKGRRPSQETREKMSQSRMGRRLTDEQRQTLSRAKIGVKTGPCSPVVCPHCGKHGAGGVMNRWHFERCKVVNGSTE